MYIPQAHVTVYVLNHHIKNGAHMRSTIKKAPSEGTSVVAGIEKPLLRIVEKPYDTVGEMESTPFGIRQAVTNGDDKGYYYPETGLYYWYFISEALSGS